MSKRLTLEFVREEIEKIGYKCLSEEYINARSHLNLQCSENHTYKTSWRHFQSGSRCLICFVSRRKKTIEEIKDYAKKFDYKCLSEKYINAYGKLKFICDCSHIFYMIWHNFQIGERCPICKNKKSGSYCKLTIEYVKDETKRIAKGYKCLSEKYINNYTDLIFLCNKNHQFHMRWGNFQQGKRCPVCYLENNRGRNHYKWKNYTNEDRMSLVLYKREVIQLSNVNYRLYKDLINPFDLKRGRNKYHIDHIYSVMDGFNNEITPEIIASPINLRMLLERENITKYDNSYLTIEQLYDLHKQFVEEEINYR